MSGISLIGVSKSFGAALVLDELDLDIPDGSVTAVLGTSGSGKTTLLRLVAGFERPDRGTITIGDEVADAQHLYVPPERRGIGYVPQEGALFPHLTVAKNIAFGLARSESRRERVEELLGLVGMGGLGGRYPHELSGGQQQRVALARAIARRPKVVLLDEPFSALDATLRASLRSDVIRILRSAGITTVLVTHDQEEALSSADLVGVITNGKIRQLATPAELYAGPTDETVARFLGEANLVPGTAASGRVSTPFGELELSGAAGRLDGEVTVLIRPEQMRIAAAAGERHGPQGGASASGKVLERQYYGHDSVVLIDTSATPEPIRVRCSGVIDVEPGDLVLVNAAGVTVAWPR